jgi:hypothetical protein
MFSHIKYVLKKGFYIHRFLLFCCSNKIHSRKFGKQRNVSQSNLDLLTALLTRILTRKEKLRIETRFKELWNESISVSRFSFWLKSFWWILEILLGFLWIKFHFISLDLQDLWFWASQSFWVLFLGEF